MCADCGNEYHIPGVTPKDKPSGYFKRPELRNKDGVATPWSSLVAVSSSISASATGFKDSSAIVLPDIVLIGQLPGAAVKAHVCIRDMCAIIGADAPVTAVAGFVYYKDVFSRYHVLAGFNSLSVVNAYATALVADAPLTDAMPSTLGSFAIELTTLTLGGATALTAIIRANIELQYEQ